MFLRTLSKQCTDVGCKSVFVLYLKVSCLVVCFTEEMPLFDAVDVSMDDDAAHLLLEVSIQTKAVILS